MSARIVAANDLAVGAAMPRSGTPHGSDKGMLMVSGKQCVRYIGALIRAGEGTSEFHLLDGVRILVPRHVTGYPIACRDLPDD